MMRHIEAGWRDDKILNLKYKIRQFLGQALPDNKFLPLKTVNKKLDFSVLIAPQNDATFVNLALH